MSARNSFLKDAILFSGATGLMSVVPPSVRRALNADPAIGSTYLDA
jgi:hypothetical protein